MPDILVSSGRHVVELRFNRPDKKNAITSAMYAALAQALEAAAADPHTRVVTILGSGGLFTAGNDLRDFMETRAAGEDLPVFRFLHALSAFPKPIVAGVGGAAIGIGTTMLLHCDLVVAAPDAGFSLPFVDLALVPEAASSLLLPRLIGPQRAARHLLLAEPFDARTALAYGLVTEIADAEALEGRVAAIARSLAARPPEAVQLTKRLLRAEEEPVPARIAREAEAFGARLQSTEAAEAFRAFFEKRPPHFG
ncbi:MAG TPA: enoyl-CoA hydratase-related protein [Allosphingosinicella sp.]|nr:enoyl-CoA hydratase-related protein [Allosphingosinicella sp.]